MSESVFLQYFYSGFIGYTTAIFSYSFYSADKIKFNYNIVLPNYLRYQINNFDILDMILTVFNEVWKVQQVYVVKSLFLF